MTRKIKILSAVIVVLLAAIFASLMPTRHTSAVTDETGSFALADSATADRFVFGNTTLQKSDSGWQVGSKYMADPLLIERMFAILQRVEVKRTVEDDAAIKTEIAEKGVDVRMMAGSDVQRSYRILGKEGETYALGEDGRVYSLYAPGVNVALHEMFALADNGWRDRTIMSTGVRTLRKLSLEYPEKPEFNVTIEYDPAFFKVPGVKKLDSAMVFNYVNALESIRAFRYIEDTQVRDSLKNAKPYCIMTVEDLSPSRSDKLSIYGNNSSIYGLLAKNEQVVLLDPKYFTKFLMRKKDFEK